MGAEAINILEKAYQLTPYDIELNYELAYKYAETKNPKVSCTLRFAYKN